MQFLLRNIFYGKFHLSLARFHRHIHSGMRKRVFCDIVVQIFHHTPDTPAVCHDIYRFFGQLRDRSQILCLKFFIEFSAGLIDQLHKIDALHVKLDIAGTDFRRFHKILRQLL